MATKAQDKAKAETALVRRVTGGAGRALPAHLKSKMKVERFERIVLSAFRRNPDLFACTLVSLQSEIMAAAEVGLDINTPLHHCYLVPFYNDKIGKKEATLIIGYEGYVELLFRGGYVAKIFAAVVCERDMFKYRLGLSPILEHTRYEGEEGRGKPTHTWCSIKFINGEEVFEVMTEKEIQAVKARSKAAQKGKSPWNKVGDMDEMRKKTVLRRLQKYAPKQAEMSRLLELDNRDYDLNKGALETPAVPGKGTQDAREDLGIPPDDEAGGPIVDAEYEDAPEKEAPPPRCKEEKCGGLLSSAGGGEWKCLNETCKKFHIKVTL